MPTQRDYDLRLDYQEDVVNPILEFKKGDSNNSKFTIRITRRGEDLSMPDTVRGYIDITGPSGEILKHGHTVIIDGAYVEVILTDELIEKEGLYTCKLTSYSLETKSGASYDAINYKVI